MRKESLTNVDFADSEFIKFEFIENKILIISIKSWKESLMKIKFTNTIQFCYKLGFQISNLFELTERTSFLEEALSRKYEIPYPKNNFREYQLLDISDFPFIQVVADNVELLKD